MLWEWEYVVGWSRGSSSAITATLLSPLLSAWGSWFLLNGRYVLLFPEWRSWSWWSLLGWSSLWQANETCPTGNIYNALVVVRSPPLFLGKALVSATTTHNHNSSCTRSMYVLDGVVPMGGGIDLRQADFICGLPCWPSTTYPAHQFQSTYMCQQHSNARSHKTRS